MTINNSASIGSERIQREVALIMKSSIDDALIFVQNSWDSLDSEYATEMGISYAPLVLEPIASMNNIYVGDRPSLIEDDTPLIHYPNVVVLVDNTIPAPISIDQASSFMTTLVIESIVKASNEFDVDRRAKRTADAINYVIQGNRTLNGLVNQLPSDPTIRFTPTFQRREERGSGKKLFMKLARLEYQIEKISNYPASWMNDLFSVDQS